MGIHIFDYVERQSAKSPLFHNFLYAVDQNEPVLRPSHRVSNLAIWSYYLGEELKHGPSYDIEIVGLDMEQEDDYNNASLTGETGTVFAISTLNFFIQFVILIKPYIVSMPSNLFFSKEMF